MFAHVLRTLVCTVLALALLVPRPASAYSHPLDWDIPNGHYYTQAGGGVPAEPRGFTITDDDGIPFWTTFQRLGGVPALGYPASQRFQRDGFVYQATQAALLQWHPGAGTVVRANVFELFEKEGLDEWLAVRGIPHPIKDDGSGGDFQKAMAVRLTWLTEPAIARFYYTGSLGASSGTAQAMERFGLPSSRPQRHGPFVIQRFQRVALQLWIESVPGMPPRGSVVPVLAGDLAKQAGIVPSLATISLPIDQVPPPVVRMAAEPIARDPVLKEALDTLRATTRGTPLEADVANLIQTATANGTRLELRALGPGVYGSFQPFLNRVSVSASLVNEDRRALAAVLYHELSHVDDFWTGRLGPTSEDCFATELTAFQRQARYWRLQFGPTGRTPPRSTLETSLNIIAEYVLEHPDRFAAELRAVYRTECG